MARKPTASTTTAALPSPMSTTAAGARRLVDLMVAHPEMFASKALEVGLPLTGISDIRLVPFGAVNAWTWQADGSLYVVQQDELRQIEAFFGALADKLADLEPTSQGGSA